MKVVFWDIEAGGLKSPFDQVLCSAFKPYGEKPYVLSRNPKDENDRNLCIDIRDELAKYDIVVGYYSLGYDKPFISGRLLTQGLKPLPRQLHIDCYRLAKKIFGWTVHSRRLVTINEILGIKGKTRVEPELWMKMKYAAFEGKKAALKEIVDHCTQDVVTLEKAFDQCFKHAIVGISQS